MISRGDRCGNRTLDEWCVSEDDGSALRRAKGGNRGPDGQDRAPDIGQNDSTSRASGGTKRLEHPLTVCAQATIRRPADSENWNTRPSHLHNEFRCAQGYLVAMRDEDQRDAARISAGSVHLPIIVETVFGMLERQSE
jgi:hypothetical protein